MYRLSVVLTLRNQQNSPRERVELGTTWGNLELIPNRSNRDVYLGSSDKESRIETEAGGFDELEIQYITEQTYTHSSGTFCRQCLSTDMISCTLGLESSPTI